jgi:molybdate transport system substrate-binding protein
MSSRNANSNGWSIGRSSLVILALLATAACSGDSQTDETVLVFAAASLADAFAGIEEAFERAHPDLDVVLNLGGSSTLRVQILEGAPADVFASADTSNMDQVVRAVSDAEDPVIFARNHLQIAVPSGNPAGVSGLTDFARHDLLIGLCAEAVPCGTLARSVLDRAGVAPTIDTNEPDVRALLTKIETGELDAGIVYVTDVESADDAVTGIEIPEHQNVVADYPIAALSGDPGAVLFVDFILSDVGQSLLGEYGFAAP